MSISRHGAGWRRLVIIATAGAAWLSFGAGEAGAHAIMSPAVARAGALQQFTLSVPTEKSGASTTKVQLFLPAGFAVDSYEPERGWKRSVVQRGSGDSAVVQEVTWTGGHVPTEEDAVFRINAQPAKAQTYRFRVVQTYSDGSVVDWSAPSENSDTPAPRIEAVTSLGGGGSTVGVIALILASIALLLSIVGVAGRGRPLT